MIKSTHSGEPFVIISRTYQSEDSYYACNYDKRTDITKDVAIIYKDEADVSIERVEAMLKQMVENRFGVSDYLWFGTYIGNKEYREISFKSKYGRVIMYTVYTKSGIAQFQPLTDEA